MEKNGEVTGKSGGSVLLGDRPRRRDKEAFCGFSVAAAAANACVWDNGQTVEDSHNLEEKCLGVENDQTAEITAKDGQEARGQSQDDPKEAKNEFDGRAERKAKETAVVHQREYELTKGKRTSNSGNYLYKGSGSNGNPAIERKNENEKAGSSKEIESGRTNGPCDGAKTVRAEGNNVDKRTLEGRAITVNGFQLEDNVATRNGGETYIPGGEACSDGGSDSGSSDSKQGKKRKREAPAVPSPAFRQRKSDATTTSTTGTTAKLRKRPPRRRPKRNPAAQTSQSKKAKQQPALDLSWKNGGKNFPKKVSQVGSDFNATNIEAAGTWREDESGI